jgi:hypothetical protein
MPPGYGFILSVESLLAPLAVLMLFLAVYYIVRSRGPARWRATRALLPILASTLGLVALFLLAMSSPPEPLFIYVSIVMVFGVVVVILLGFAMLGAVGRELNSKRTPGPPRPASRLADGLEWVGAPAIVFGASFIFDASGRLQVRDLWIGVSLALLGALLLGVAYVVRRRKRLGASRA